MTENSLNYQGFYINLDRRPDRRTEIEAELTRFGLLQNYRHFSAVEGNALSFANPHLTPGEMGCFSSHYKVLKQNIGSTKHIHIIEDDVIFSPRTAQVIETIIAQDMFAGCDIIYTDVFVPVQAAAYKAYKRYFDQAVTRGPDGKLTVKAFGVVSLKGLPFGSTTSYIVHKDSIGKVHDFYAKQIAAEPHTSSDLYLRALNDAGMLKIGCIFPFVTSVRLDHIVGTDIEHDYHKMSGLAAHLARYAFFADADLGECRRYLDTYLKPPAADDQVAQILARLLGFSLTDEYKDF